MLRILEEIGHFAYFSYKSLLVLPASLLNPRETTRQFYRILIGALPLGLVAGLAIGLVLWMQLRGPLVRTAGKEAIPYLPTAVALAVVLEFAPIGAGLIVAGRTGASLGAELGAMRLTEQIDALESMGQSSMKRLIGPRVLACMLALPLLTIFIAVLAILAAFAAEMLTGTITSLQYEMNTWNGLRMEDVVPSVLKTLFFGFVTGVSGCYFGMKAQGGTEGVGHAATRGVELSTLLVLIANVLLVRLIQLLIP
ncbi:MAG TPA: ABC transporter permease [Gemmataceae bacterium]|nr:ABC transporter permease [Gemmataceae bacterium]